MNFDESANGLEKVLQMGPGIIYLLPCISSPLRLAFPVHFFITLQIPRAGSHYMCQFYIDKKKKKVT